MKNILSDVFGSQLEKYEKINVKLPLYLTDNRLFFNVKLCGIEIIIVFDEQYGRFNVASLKKQLITYIKEFEKPVVYGFDSVTTFQRKSLIENGISFVSKNGQLFIPTIGAVFSKCISKQINSEVNHFAPTTQMLFLLLVYGEDGLEINKSTAADILGLAPMSVTRAAKQLVQLGIVAEQKDGTEVKISKTVSKEEMYEIAKPYLINPIQKIAYVLREDMPEGLLIAGEEALADRTELGYFNYTECTMSKDEFLQYEVSEFDPKLEINSELMKIQIWKYNPRLFSQNDKVDPISLICSFGDNEDERIHQCLEDIEKEIDTWRIEMQI